MDKEKVKAAEKLRQLLNENWDDKVLRSFRNKAGTDTRGYQKSTTPKERKVPKMTEVKEVKQDIVSFDRLLEKVANLSREDQETTGLYIQSFLAGYAACEAKLNRVKTA